MENQLKLEWGEKPGDVFGSRFAYAKIALLEVNVWEVSPWSSTFQIEGKGSLIRSKVFSTLTECQLAAESQLLEMFKAAVKELEGKDNPDGQTD